MYKYNTARVQNKPNTCIFRGDNCTLKCLLFNASLLVLLVCSHEGGEDAVLLLQQGLGPLVLQDDPTLHHNHHVGIQDGVDAVLQEEEEDSCQRKGGEGCVCGNVPITLTAMVTTVRSTKAVITTFCRMLSCRDREGDYYP